MKFCYGTTFSKQTQVLFICILSLLAVILTEGMRFKRGPDKVIGDQANNFTMGYNLYKKGVLSLDQTVEGEIKPTAYREPICPFIISIFLRLYPGNVPDDIKQVLKPKENIPLHMFVYFNQSIILLLVTIISALFLWKFTGNWIITVVPIFILMWFISWQEVNAGSSESLAKLLFLVVSILLLRAYQNPTGLRSLLSGLSIGVLTLTKAIFSYMLWPAAAIIVIAGLKHRKCAVSSSNVHPWKQIVLLFVAVIAGYYAIVGPWLIRNKIHFGEWFITFRSEEVLAIRAEYNKMTLKEYFISFLWWTPFLNDKIVRKYIPYDDYKNLYRSYPGGYYQRGLRITSNIKNKSNDHVEWRARLKKYAIKEILDHPVRHVLVTIPLAYQGLFFMGMGTISLISLPLAMIGLYRLLKTRLWETAVFLLPSLYCFSMYAFFSHNIPRYNEPLTSVTAILAGVGVWVIAEKISKRPINFRSPENTSVT